MTIFNQSDYRIAIFRLTNAIYSISEMVAQAELPKNTDKHDKSFCSSIREALSAFDANKYDGDFHNLSHHCITLLEIYNLNQKHKPLIDELKTIKKTLAQYH